MILRKNQKRIRVPSEAHILSVTWCDHIKCTALLLDSTPKEKHRKKSNGRNHYPQTYCRINDDFIEIFPPAPYASTLTIGYTINGIL